MKLVKLVEGFCSIPSVKVSKCSSILEPSELSSLPRACTMNR